MQSALHPFRVVAPDLADALRETQSAQIVDLCAGGAGPWARLLPELDRALRGPQPQILLTDLFPNLTAFEKMSLDNPGRVAFVRDPVDATRVEIPGFRTIFNAFHHLDEPQARGVLQDAVRQGAGIGIFELADRSAAFLLGSITIPLQVWLTTPFIQPRAPTRLALTYGLPVVPLVAWIDGMISGLRTYSTDELRALVQSLDGSDAGYTWKIGRKPYLGPLCVTYLIGTPPSARSKRRALSRPADAVESKPSAASEPNPETPRS
ncbi:MAG: class I SAM-dependent methyltransferase [Deltaproteobacteria bacterium]|nr:class I SAM-dependent methyltransferase [Deltaproteobacteria bacterium]